MSFLSKNVCGGVVYFIFAFVYICDIEMTQK